MIQINLCQMYQYFIGIYNVSGTWIDDKKYVRWHQYFHSPVDV